MTVFFFFPDTVKVIVKCVYRKGKVYYVCLSVRLCVRVCYLALLWLGYDDLSWLEGGGGGGCGYLLALLLPLHLYSAGLLRQREVVLHGLCRGNRLTHLLLQSYTHTQRYRVKPITGLHLHK